MYHRSGLSSDAKYTLSLFVLRKCLHKRAFLQKSKKYLIYGCLLSLPRTCNKETYFKYNMSELVLEGMLLIFFRIPSVHDEFHRIADDIDHVTIYEL